MAQEFWSDKPLKITISGKSPNNSGIPKIDITGEKMMPKKVLIANVEGSKTIDAISVIEDNKISIDKGLLYSGVNSVSLIYQSLDGKYEATTIYMLTN